MSRLKPSRPQPRFGLTFTDDAVLATRYNDGKPVITYPVELVHIASALNVGGISTGLLPEGCIYVQQRGAVTTWAIWAPPSRRTLLYAKRSIKDAPVPGLVWIGTGKSWQIWACPERPRDLKAKFFIAPFSNVYENSGVCNGTVQFPIAAGDTIVKALDLFFESGFNDDLSFNHIRSRQSLQTFWAGLSGKRTFPIKELLPAQTTLSHLLEGS